MPPSYPESEVDQMQALYEEGLTVTEIAATLGRGRNTVAKRLKERGIEFRGGEGWRSRKLDPELEIELVRLYEDGVPVAELQERYDCGKTYVYALLDKYEVVRRRAKHMQEEAERASRIRGFEGRVRHPPSNSMVARTYRIRDRNRQYLWDYYSTHPCVDCGETDPVVLEADHVRGVKKYNVGAMAHSTRSLRAIDEELAKCDVVCANCHRRRTAVQQGWYDGVTREAA